MLVSVPRAKLNAEPEAHDPGPDPCQPLHERSPGTFPWTGPDPGATGKSS